MSSAHGAGLMLLPFVLAGRTTAAAAMTMPIPRTARGLPAG